MFDPPNRIRRAEFRPRRLVPALVYVHFSGVIIEVGRAGERRGLCKINQPLQAECRVIRKSVTESETGLVKLSAKFIVWFDDTLAGRQFPRNLFARCSHGLHAHTSERPRLNLLGLQLNQVSYVEVIVISGALSAGEVAPDSPLTVLSAL